MRQLTIRIRYLVLAFSLIPLHACVPVLAKYPNYDVPEAVYLRSRGTGALGPPRMVYYPYHGIHVSFLLRTVMFGVHVPPGVVVQINDTNIRIEGSTSRGKYEESFPIQAAPHSSIGDNVFPDLYGQRDPLTAANYLGPLTGGRAGDPLTWYLFRGKDPQNLEHTVLIPNTLVMGTVILPSLTINGTRFESQRLTFTAETAAGLECAMCN